MLYITYCLFDQMIIYKPRVNKQSQEYYLIGLNYSGIDQVLMHDLLKLHKTYNDGVIIKSSDIPQTFLFQLEKIQNKLIYNFNNFIKSKIFFADNFKNLTYDDWQIINTTSREKIKEWLDGITK